MQEAPRKEQGDARVVGAVELLLAACFAPASTTLRTGTCRLGITVADLVVASCFAPTLFPFLVPKRPLAAEPTASGERCVAGVAHLLLPSTLLQTSATPVRRPLRWRATAAWKKWVAGVTGILFVSRFKVTLATTDGEEWMELE